MFRRNRLLTAVVAWAIVQCVAGCRTSQSHDADSGKTQDRKTLLHAPGTIVSVEERAHDEQSEDLLPGPHICYTIDSFAEIPPFDRNAYESAERKRQAVHGPRCHDTAVDPSAVHFKPGDHLDVYFTLAEGSQISVVKISLRGVDL